MRAQVGSLDHKLLYKHNQQPATTFIHHNIKIDQGLEELQLFSYLTLIRSPFALCNNLVRIAAILWVQVLIEIFAAI